MEYMKSQLLIPFDTEPPETILRIGPVTRLELGQLISVLKENSQPALLLGTMDLIFEEINNQIGMRLRASSPTSSQSRPFEQNFTVGALLNMLGGGDEVRELMSQIDNADVQPVLAAMVAGFDVSGEISIISIIFPERSMILLCLCVLDYLSAADLNLKPVHDILQAANKLVSAETTFKLDANAKHILGGTEIMELFGIPETSNIECKSVSSTLSSAINSGYVICMLCILMSRSWRLRRIGVWPILTAQPKS